MDVARDNNTQQGDFDTFEKRGVAVTKAEEFLVHLNALLKEYDADLLYDNELELRFGDKVYSLFEEGGTLREIRGWEIACGTDYRLGKEVTW